MFGESNSVKEERKRLEKERKKVRNKVEIDSFGHSDGVDKMPNILFIMADDLGEKKLNLMLIKIKILGRIKKNYQLLFLLESC